MAADVASFDHIVPHRSTVPAVAGQPVKLFVRERTLAEGPLQQIPIVLVHGGYWPSTVAFDLPLPGYSFMETLARAGFATFAVDMTGYGRSTRPMMDDPANVVADHRPMLGERAEGLGAPSYPFELVTAESERNDIDAVVNFVRRRTGADKVFLFGWSGGGFRTGTYTVHHPDKVAALVIQASSNFAADGAASPPLLPKPGAPVQIQDRATGERQRWLDHIRDADQVAPHVPDVVWRESMASDPVGATWGSGVLRSPKRTYWGWNAAAAGCITVPTLVIVGEEDRLLESNRILYRSLGTGRKAFVACESATHFMVWEKGRRILSDAVVEWFSRGTFRGSTSGSFRIAADGTSAPLPL